MNPPRATIHRTTHIRIHKNRRNEECEKALTHKPKRVGQPLENMRWKIIWLQIVYCVLRATHNVLVQTAEMSNAPPERKQIQTQI